MGSYWTIACTAGNRQPPRRLGMHQQANVNEALPVQGTPINELFAQHYKASLLTAYRLLRSKEDSEDAVQTAYFSAFRHFHGFRGESSFKTWITRIVVNCCLMQLRDRRARPQVPLDDAESTVASNAATPEVLCYRAELEAAHARAASRTAEIASGCLCGICDFWYRVPQSGRSAGPDGDRREIAVVSCP